MSNLRKAAALALLLIIVITFAGCFGDDDSSAVEVQPSEQVSPDGPSINKVGKVVSVYMGDFEWGNDDGDNVLDLEQLDQAQRRCNNGVLTAFPIARADGTRLAGNTTYVVFICN